MPINFAIKLGATIAVEALSVGLQATKRTYGPRLDELTVTVADYGTPLPRFLGERKFACPLFHAEDLKEVKKTTKVKGGGKQTTYHYLATFACAIADNPIDSVLKIWFDDKLVYDATGTGPISVASSLNIDLSQVMRIYLGTEDQLPDPRYVTYCEDKFGPDTAPAYRGVSYLFFEELPVDNFGNRIPQISVLAASSASGHFPYDTLTTTSGNSSAFAFAPSGAWLAYYGPTRAIEWWDRPTRTRIGSSPDPNTLIGFATNVSLLPDGTAYMVGDVQRGVDVDVTLFVTSPLGTPTGTVTDAPSNSLGVCRAFQTSNGVKVYTSFATHAGYIDFDTYTSLSDSARDWCLDADGDVWMASQPTGSSSNFTLTNMTSGGATTFTGTSRSGPSSLRMCFVEDNGSFFVDTDGHFYIIDKGTMTVTASGTAPWSAPPTLFPALTNRKTFWDFASGFNEYSLEDGSLIRTIPSGSWISSSYAEKGFDPVVDGVWARVTSSSTLRVLYVDRIASDGVALGDIVDAMCDAASLTDRDTTALTQTVAGYSWTRGDVKSQMEPVLDIHDVDARPHDFEIEFLPRGNASVGTILTGDFAKSGDSPRYKVTIAQDTDLPKMLRVNFADTGFDQQTNNVLSPLTLNEVDSQRDDTIDLTPYAATPAVAQQLADRYMRRQWNSRETIESSLTAQQLAREPGDVVTLDLDGIQQNARLTKQTIVGGRIDCTFVRDEIGLSALNSSTTGPNMDGRDTQVITVPSPIQGFVMDITLREDADADLRPLLYTGAGSYGQLSFPGAAIYEATGTGDTLAYDQLFASVSTGATWGLCNGALATADPNLWDRGNTLNVSLQSGSLTSVSEADIDADPTLNLIVVGATGRWEYINFTTATLQGDGSYTLSGFKRGRRGTEWARSLHQTGDAWVLASSLTPDELGSDDVADDLSFKAQAIGRTIDAAPAIDIDAFSGASLKPYAPARVKWYYDGTDLQGTITRRTRIGGAWVGGSTIPLSENSEEYEIDVYNGATFKRTITVSGTNTFTYTSAMATADGITLPTPPTINAYQMSDAVGRGFALAA